MKFNHSHIPLLILASVIVLVSMALYGYMFQATSVSVGRAVTAQNVVASEQGNKQKAKTLTSLASSTASDREMLLTFFISSDDIVSFITAIESLGPKSGSTLNITSIDADQMVGAPAGKIGKARAHVDAHGSWSSVMRLLDLAEVMPYAVTISHVRLNSSGATAKSNDAWSLAFDIQVSIIAPTTASSTTK